MILQQSLANITNNFKVNYKQSQHWEGYFLSLYDMKILIFCVYLYVYWCLAFSGIKLFF